VLCHDTLGGLKDEAPVDVRGDAASQLNRDDIYDTTDEMQRDDFLVIEDLKLILERGVGLEYSWG
jgi:hypothetical protein